MIVKVITIEGAVLWAQKNQKSEKSMKRKASQPCSKGIPQQLTALLLSSRAVTRKLLAELFSCPKSWSRQEMLYYAQTQAQAQAWTDDSLRIFRSKLLRAISTAATNPENQIYYAEQAVRCDCRDQFDVSWRTATAATATEATQQGSPPVMASTESTNSRMGNSGDVLFVALVLTERACCYTISAIAPGSRTGRVVHTQASCLKNATAELSDLPSAVTLDPGAIFLTFNDDGGERGILGRARCVNRQFLRQYELFDQLAEWTLADLGSSTYKARECFDEYVRDHLIPQFVSAALIALMHTTPPLPKDVAHLALSYYLPREASVFLESRTNKRHSG